VSRQSLSNHLACLRGCGLVTAVPEGRRTVYTLADERIRRAVLDLMDLVLVTDPTVCPDAGEGLLLMTTDAGTQVTGPGQHLSAERLGRRAQLLAATSVAYNLVEAGIAVTAGAVASSTALVAFGLDSLVEVSSGLVILWQFRHAMPADRERVALKAIGVSSFDLAPTSPSVRSVRSPVTWTRRRRWWASVSLSRR
jgi:hypothetical protein